MYDASDIGVDCVIFQEENGVEHPIAYGNSTLTKSQTNSITLEKESYAFFVGNKKI